MDALYTNAAKAYNDLIKTVNDPGFQITELFKLYSKNTAIDFELKIKPLLETRKRELDGFNEGYLSVSKNLFYFLR